MLPKGFLDSPPDQSENLRVLETIERQLRTCGSEDDWELALSADHEQILRELWTFVLDVVCSPLWLRIRAAELLNVCFTLRQEYLRVDVTHAHWLRSVVSSTCQLLDELNPHEEAQATSLFHWLAFLEHLLVATNDSLVFARVFRHATYAGMLAKMLRLLGQSSTQVFAATTICLAAFHRHELHIREARPDSPSVLLDTVLRDAGREGSQHLGGALLHVINSCGYPCPDMRRCQLDDAIQLLYDILAHPEVFEVVFVNDFKVVIDVVLRECTDLPLEATLRARYLLLLDVVVGSPLFLRAQQYRKTELLQMLEELLAAGVEEDSGVPPEVTQLVQDLLLHRIDRLD